MIRHRKGRDVRETCDCSNPGHVAVVSDCPAHVSTRADEQADHKDKPKLGLIDAAVSSRHPDDPPVSEGTSNNDSNDTSDETGQMGQTLENVTNMQFI